MITRVNSYMHGMRVTKNYGRMGGLLLGGCGIVSQSG